MPTMIEKMIVCMVASLLVLSAFPSVVVGSGVDVDVGVDLSGPYFRFASLDAAALAEITHPEPTTPEAMQKVLHPTTISSYEKIDLPGKKYTDDEARSLWAQHLAQYPGRKKYSQAENEKRFEIFRKNLEKVSEQNFLHGGGFSYKAAFADLSSNEFAKMKGLVFKTEDIIHDQKADEKKRATKARDKAYADWVSFRNTFGVDAKNPYKTPYNETAKGKAKLARYRQVKQALANLAAKKKAATIAEQKRLTALAVKQSAMRDMKKAKQAKVKADAEAKKAAKKLADAKKKEEIAKKQASKKLANQKAKAAKEAKLAAQKKKKAEKAAADKAVKDKKVSESRAKASAAKAEKQRAVAEKKAQQAAAKAKKALEKARAAEEKAKKAAEKAAAKAQSAAAATPTASKVLMELEADAEAELDAESDSESDSLDAEQLASDALIADQLDAEVNALSDLDASTEVDSLHGLDGALDASAESTELAFLELDAELMEFLGVDADEQQSIFARFETREPVEVDVVTPIGETPVKSPPREGTIPLAEKNAQRASNAGAHNLEFPGEVSVEIPGVPVATPPAKPTPDTAVVTPITTAATSSTPAATVAAAVADAASAIAAAVATVAAPSTTVNASPATTLPTVGMQPAANPTPTVQPTAQPTVQPTVQPTSTASSTSSGSAILSPAIAGAYKPTAAVRRMATDKSVIDIDWRTKVGVLSPVKSQGQCGSCWAQSAITVVESLISIRKNHTVVPLSVQQVVSCDNQDSGCDGGNPITALAYLSNWAVSSETHYPYDQNAFANGGSAPVCNETLVKSGFPYVQDSTTYENDEIVMAQALQRGPLSALVDASKWQFYDGSKIVYPASGCGNTVSSLDHSVVIVGLGTLSNGERYWIVRNHWDSSWGAGGYIFLAYGQNTCGIALQVTEATLSEKAFSQ